MLIPLYFISEKFRHKVFHKIWVSNSFFFPAISLFQIEHGFSLQCEKFHDNLFLGQILSRFFHLDVPVFFERFLRKKMGVEWSELKHWVIPVLLYSSVANRLKYFRTIFWIRIPEPNILYTVPTGTVDSALGSRLFCKYLGELKIIYLTLWAW